MKKIIEKGSERFKLNTTDFKKIGKGALIAIIGALLTYGTDYVMKLETGKYVPLIVAVWSIVANACWKFLKDNSNTTN